MKTTKDYRDGFASGKLHNPKDALCVDNLPKIESGMKSDLPRIKDYWTGYNDGMNLIIESRVARPLLNEQWTAGANSKFRKETA